MSEQVLLKESTELSASTVWKGAGTVQNRAAMAVFAV
jgi:hypothetical protein